jgi:hypothetical protein
MLQLQSLLNFPQGSSYSSVFLVFFWVQFQTFNANMIASSSAPKAEYQKQTTDANEVCLFGFGFGFQVIHFFKKKYSRLSMPCYNDYNFNPKIIDR